ncbi:RNA-directed DNA polymerase, eukaryota, reverse transcriptase zinc-binding domain protein [Tanacetum coccineum]
MKIEVRRCYCISSPLFGLVPSKLVDSDYGTVNVKNGKNKKKKDVIPDGVCNEGLNSQNDEHVENLDDSQIGVVRETVEVEKNENLVSEEIEGNGMVNGKRSNENQNANSQRDQDEGKKFSYAKIVNNGSLDNKLNLIPTEVNDDGTEVVIFDEEIVKEGSKKWELTVCGYFVGYKMSYQESRYTIYGRNETLGGKWETNISKRISAITSRLGTSLIIDQTTTNMCNLGNRRPGFARVLVDVKGGKGLPDRIDIVYKNKEGVITGNKSVNVNYDWVPLMCTCCKMFGHNDKNCKSRPRTVEEFIEKERNDLKQKHENGEFVRVQNRKRGVKKVNISDANKKENEGDKSKKVMYKPAEKRDPKAGEKIQGKKGIQVNERGSSKTNWNADVGDLKHVSGGSNTKNGNNSMHQHHVRNKNKFDVLREYNGNETQGNDRQNEIEEIEEDDVLECSGMASSMNEDEVIGLDSNQTMLCIIEDIHSHMGSFVSFVYAANGRVSFVSNEMQEFNECVDMIEVEDLCSSGLFFTWTKNLKKARERDETGVLKKLDRVMVNEDFLKKFDQAHVIFNPYLVSDRKSFIPTVEKEWKKQYDGFQMFQLVKKMRNLKIHLRSLNWQNGNLFDKVEEVRDEMKNIQKQIDKDPYNKVLRSAEVKILKEYMTIMEYEEKLLFQKSKIKWLSLGDRNNSFFHKTLKGRYQKNRIKKIQDVNGKCFKGQDVADQFEVHFKNFLGQSYEVKEIDEPFSLFKNKISDDEALSLVEDISYKEIKDALFDIGDNKAPGLDGYSSIFFKKAWKVIGDDFCKAVKEFFNYGKLLKDLNSTVISLIPKSQNPLKVTDYRPIACCNVVYKCISKVITGRIKKVLGKLVNINQSAFVAGRQIQDNILLTQELLKGYNRKGGPSRVACKIDIQKAYDTVN